MVWTFLAATGIAAVAGARYFMARHVNLSVVIAIVAFGAVMIVAALLETAH
ncbi:MAG TPA: hypothetical protein VGG10_05140 [Rhizomicrobium sp.]|jgi:hypothetical protein